MEIFLLWLDELDDAVALFWALLPRLMGLLVAVAMLIATGFAFLSLPELALPSVALLLGASLLSRLRRHLPLDPLNRDS